MKTKPTLVLLLLVLASVAGYSQAEKAIRVSLMKPSCGCSGRVRVEIDKDALVPMTIALTHEKEAQRVFHGVTKPLEIDGLCSGLWKVSASPERLEHCTPVEEQIQVPEVKLAIRTLRITNPSAADQTNGRIVAQAYAVDGNGAEYASGFHFSYQWSNGRTGNELQNVGTGVYTLVATNTETGCAVRKDFQLSACSALPTAFEVIINGGIASGADGDFIPLSLSFRKNPQEEFGPVPGEYVVEWDYGDQEASGTEISVPISMAPMEVVVLVYDACGNSKTVRKRIVTCEASEQEIKNSLISQIIEPCFGHDDGGVVLNFTGTKGDNIHLELDGRVIFDKTTGEGVQSVGESFLTVVPSLRGGRTYTISGYLGDHCPINFSFVLPEKEPEKVCVDYDKKEKMCIYDEECNGQQTGPSNNYRSPAFTMVSEENVRGWTDKGLFPRCRSDLFCLCSGKYEKKEKGKEAWKTVRIGEYWEILENHGRNTGVDLLSTSPSAGKDPCGHITYCTLDPAVYSGSFNFAEKEKRSLRQSVIRDGKDCTQFTCKTLGIFRSKFTACVTNIPPTPDPPTQVVGGIRLCDYRGFNLLQMLVWHKNGTLSRRFPGPEAKLKYQGSKLENYLKGFTDLTDKKLRCASITFCINDLNGNLTVNFQTNPCGLVYYDDEGIPRKSCEIYHLVIGEKGYGEGVSQQEKEDLFSSNQNALKSAVFFCNNSSNITYVNYQSNLIQASFPGDPIYQDVPIKSPYAARLAEDKLLQIFLEDPLEEDDDRLEVRISDDYDQEHLLRFGELTFENQRIPKGIMAIDSLHFFADFVFGNQVLTKTPAHHLIFQASNWDTRTDVYMEENEPGSKYGFLFSDTLIEYHGVLTSQAFIKPQHLSIQDTSLVIAGMFQGDLQLDSILIGYSDHLSAFYLKVSRQGIPQGIQIVEKIDTLQGIHFSESRQGQIALAAGFDQGVLTVNGQTATMPFQKGIVLFRLNQDQAQVVQKIEGNDPVLIKGISFDPDTTQIGLLLYGLDSLRQGVLGVTGQGANKVSIASFSSEGILKWSASVAADHLDLLQMSISDGLDNGIFAGFTFRDSLRIGSRLLASKGEEDIAIIKFNSAGEIVQIDTIGSPDRETISQMMHSDYLLFFGGTTNGPTKTRTLGLMDYYNETEFDERVYISAISDTIGLDLQPTDTVAESALSKAPLTEVAQEVKPLQLSVPLFVFPNPFQEELNLQFHAQESEIWEIRLLDNLGSVVRKQPQPVTEGFNNTRFSTFSVPPGMYFLQCVSAKGYVLQSAKVVKVK